MERTEFFDKIDNIRKILSNISDGDSCDSAIKLLDELREDAELMLDDEYDLGLNHGWNHLDQDEM